jgi:hypothetical protein
VLGTRESVGGGEEVSHLDEWGGGTTGMWKERSEHRSEFPTQCWCVNADKAYLQLGRQLHNTMGGEPSVSESVHSPAREHWCGGTVVWRVQLTAEHELYRCLVD